ncbi:DUF2510 domain-containing protein [Microbacterium sp. CBA3102]|uniref:DUF2510 domain-containing protein n=1 Tax=Microbacterium sp. CBA3102 TaxID=2603598 RepID=UPI0011BAF347|nr:DUF2510 domain-containing protein [Microbacterium sp. CBA3102]QEA30149.1 DUF2510 domain-containing protein [Microbacterium sp. CBA3102]
MTTPAGWYDDGSGNQRWWDGQQWTEHVVAAPPRPAEPAPEPAPAPAPDGDPVPATPEPAPFAPPYMMAPADPTPVAGPTMTGYPGASGVVGDPWAVPAAPPAATGTPVLGIIGLVTVVVGVIGACVPVIAIAGWSLLAIGFILSLVSLFLRGRKWPGITGMVVAAIGAVLAVAVSLVLLGVASAAGGAGSPSGAPAERPSTNDGSGAIEGAEMVSFADLRVGDCLPFVDYSDEEGNIYELPVVPCADPHTDEVFFIYDLEGEEFPGDGALQDQAWDGCLSEFEAYVGTSYMDSVLDYYTYQPTESSWVRGDDRTVHCILYSYEDVTGTLKDAAY